MLQPLQVLDLILLLAPVLGVAWALAAYISRVYSLGDSTSASGMDNRIFAPIENAIYRIVAVNPLHMMGWKEYALSAIIVNLVQMVIAALILAFQGVLPLNPQGYPGLSWHLIFNIVTSFATNTDLQHYRGETTLSYFSQMTAIQFLQFTAAATGISIAVAMVRCFVAGAKDLGNFYVDFTRSLTRILLPMCLIASVIFVALGVPQSLGGYEMVKTVEGATQTIIVGPVASLVAVMQLGTNGGGYFGANSAYPFQNPSPATDALQIFLMLLIPTSLCFVFGRMIGRKRESLPIIVGAYALFVIDLAIAFTPNPVAIGPGLETRFGGFMSTFWTVVTTAAGTGSLNSLLSGMNPLAILSALLGMMIQATPGGSGLGLMYMLMFVVITVFIVGLMSGRTPEYLGMKIIARDVKLVMLAFLVHPIIVIVPTFIAFASGAPAAIGVGTNSIGFTKILYEFTSAAANNGSDFLGASAASSPFFNVSTGVVMLLGRYLPIVLLLALGGSMIGRNRSTNPASLKTSSISFSVVLIASIILLVALTFFPFLALGPILSYFQGSIMNGFG